MSLKKYLFYYDLKYYAVNKDAISPYTKDEEYKDSQKVFNEVRRNKPQFSMKDVHGYVDNKIAEHYATLHEADKFTLLIQNKTPEDCPKWRTAQP